MGWESLMLWTGLGYNFETPIVLIDVVPNESDEGMRMSVNELNAERNAEKFMICPLNAALQLLQDLDKVPSNIIHHATAVALPKVPRRPWRTIIGSF
jgi:hypothetical protein